MFRKLKKAWKKVKQTVKKVVRAVAESANRLLGVIDLIAFLVGIRPTKYLRLQVFILTEHGRPIQREQVVQGWIDEAKRIFKERMNIEIVSAQPRTGMLATITLATPREVMNVEGCDPLFMVSDAADWLDDQCKYVITTSWSPVLDTMGFGDPVFAFIVRSVSGAEGCAWPVLCRFAVVDRDPRPTTLAHELAHLCGLRDNDVPRNLMSGIRSDTESELSIAQIGWARNSRHVTYFRTSP